MAVTRFFQKFTVNGVDNLSNPLQLVMTENKKVEAVYEENGMGTVNIKAVITAGIMGETVTFGVTKPDLSTVAIVGILLADKTATVQFTSAVGSYTAVASVAQVEDANNIYLAATSSVKAFTIAKTSTVRTITLEVS